MVTRLEGSTSIFWLAMRMARIISGTDIMLLMRSWAMIRQTSTGSKSGMK